MTVYTKLYVTEIHKFERVCPSGTNRAIGFIMTIDENGNTKRIYVNEKWDYDKYPAGIYNKDMLIYFDMKKQKGNIYLYPLSVEVNTEVA